MTNVKCVILLSVTRDNMYSLSMTRRGRYYLKRRSVRVKHFHSHYSLADSSIATKLELYAREIVTYLSSKICLNPSKRQGRSSVLHQLVCHELAHPRPILSSRASRSSLRSQGNLQDGKYDSKSSHIFDEEREIIFFNKEYDPRPPNMG